jgi:hypothetical protein
MIPKYYTKLFIEEHEDKQYKDCINNIIYNLWLKRNELGSIGELVRTIIRQLKQFSNEERNKYYLRMYEVHRRENETNS